MPHYSGKWPAYLTSLLLGSQIWHTARPFSQFVSCDVPSSTTRRLIAQKSTLHTISALSLRTLVR